MNLDCQTFRDELLAAGLPDTATSTAPQLREHVAGCAECAAWARRSTRLAHELEVLPRPALPAELEGLVVAALQAGQRQARAAQAIAALGRVSSPPDLDRAVDAELGEALDLEEQPETEASDALARLAVPGVLDRLVAEELASPSQARARRYLGSLRRRRAPEELRLRVGLVLADRAGFLDASRTRPRAHGLHLAVGLMVAALLVVIGALVLRPTVGEQRPGGPQIVIERVADPSDLPPIAAALFDGASGGLLSVEEGS
jgi:hypothetical protein